MTDEIFQEVASFFVLLFVAPYIIGPPIALVWVLTAYAVRWATGWKGLLPADVWHIPGKGDPWSA